MNSNLKNDPFHPYDFMILQSCKKEVPRFCTTCLYYPVERRCLTCINCSRWEERK